MTINATKKKINKEKLKTKTDARRKRQKKEKYSLSSICLANAFLVAAVKIPWRAFFRDVRFRFYIIIINTEWILNFMARQKKPWGWNSLQSIPILISELPLEVGRVWLTLEFFSFFFALLILVLFILFQYPQPRSESSDKVTIPKMSIHWTQMNCAKIDQAMNTSGKQLKVTAAM